MEELHHHLQQLPGFLQAELAAHVGDWNGTRYIDITDKHIHAINHLVASKRAPLRQDHIDNSYFLWGTDPWDKSSLEGGADLFDFSSLQRSGGLDLSGGNSWVLE
ncbi:hypothetical protein AL047_15170 [Pseudomonas syringae pv. broussonetiae]|nr:hypothetical protein AL047_15170 [Pseudomonas syringae pv. broussonetiae]